MKDELLASYRELVRRPGQRLEVAAEAKDEIPGRGGGHDRP